MADPTQALRRRPALAEPDIGRNLGLAPDTLALQLLPPRARSALRIDPAHLPTNGRVAGFTLDMPINRWATSAAGTAARLGPNEWLLRGPESNTERIAHDVEASLAGRHYSLVDIGHRQVAFAVSGAGAADVINCGCPLDLSPAAFPAGAATRTLLGKCEIVLVRTNDQAFEIECGRSYAAYVADFLTEAARGLARNA
jgi:sarcosine oxidase subunit gamma